MTVLGLEANQPRNLVALKEYSAAYLEYELFHLSSLKNRVCKRMAYGFSFSN